MFGDGKTFKSSLKYGVSAVAIAVFVDPNMVAHAQVDEIMVTARKRAESVQDVPLSIQAFSGEDLERQGLQNLEDYANSIPGLTYSSWQPGSAIVVFRGVTTSAESFDSAQSSATYLDEVPIQSNGQNADVRLYDIERLEAVSGPQPTTYGGSSQSGTLKIVTKKPVMGEFEAWLDVGGSYMEEGEESYDVSWGLNLPVVEDKMAVRLVGFKAKEGGYIDNVYGVTKGKYAQGNKDNAGLEEEDVNSSEYEGVRIQARWEPNEDWQVTLGATFQNNELGGGFSYDPSVGDLKQVRFKKESRNDDWYLTALTIEGDLGFADLTIVTGYMDRDISYDTDATAYMQNFFDCHIDAALGDDCSYAVYNVGLGPGYGKYYLAAYTSYTQLDFISYASDPTALMHLDENEKRFSQEIRLTSKDEGNISWMIGAFYEKFEDSYKFWSWVDDFEATYAHYFYDNFYSPYGPMNYYNDANVAGGLPDNAAWFYSDFYKEDTQWAVFGEFGIDVTEKLNVLVGARYFDSDQTYQYLAQAPQGYSYACLEPDPLVLGGDACVFDGDGNPMPNLQKGSDDGVATLLTLTYNIDDNTMVYFTRSEGFRVGGVNITKRASTAPRNYVADEVVNYEIGLKSISMDGRLTLNGAAYIMPWEDMQLQVADPTVGGYSTIILNTGKAEIKGIDVNFAYQATDQFQISGAVSYTDAKVTEDLNFDGLDIVLDGDELPLSPDWKYNIGLQYDMPLPNMDAESWIRFDYTYVGEQLNSTRGSLLLTGTGEADPLIQPDYNLGNLSYGITKDKWEVEFSLRNIWDERAVLFLQPRFADGRVTTNRPREFSINFRYDF
ncbi:MAG: TonB-dependent receptor [Alphaproteobacteria bacterium]|nr:MAG: TonB-dependent receptor [Alphaproteobacteria bacterium]